MKLILAARIENPITKYPNKEATYSNTNIYHKRQNSPEIASRFSGYPWHESKTFLGTSGFVFKRTTQK